ncbi:hypothetical protein U14_03879 [Candidatus Moduliflexus flocculans]|uniref:DUF4367 domain-containing protein n=1 Tax=Candidatus Moduliflexus flocculans TaxID=1499966 RepID=A0A081BQG1_9BACT|nr:hypothetical protein U14_03879 [Candidatus Moduliflexus flocculans]
MKKTWLNSVFCSLMLLVSSFSAAEELTVYLPTLDDLPGWKMEDAPQQAKGDELFSMVDGAAEVYFEYGFSRALVQYYANDQGQSLQIEIYEMTDPAAAYGIFSFHAGDESQPIAIGRDGIIGEYYLSFWQNAYFVMLSASDPAPELLDLLKQIAQKMAAKLPAKGERPALVMRLLAQHPAPLDVKYIKGKLGLFNLTSFDADVTNGFDEGAIADFDEFEIVLLHYRGEQALAASFEQTRDMFETGATTRYFTKEAQSFSFIDKEGTPIYGVAQQSLFCLISGKQPQGAADVCRAIMTD